MIDELLIIIFLPKPLIGSGQVFAPKQQFSIKVATAQRNDKPLLSEPRNTYRE